MDARHLTAPVARRRTGNAIGLVVLALTIAAATFALDPSGPPKLPSRARNLLTAPDGSGVLLVGTPESPVQRLADGSIVGVNNAKPPGTSAAAIEGVYSATATASLLYQGPGGGAAGGRSIGTSAANVSTDGSKMTALSRLGATLIDGATTGTTAVGRVELLPGVAALTTQAASPSKTGTTSFGAVTPERMPLGFTALGGRANAYTTGTNACVGTGRVVDASSELAAGDLGRVPLIGTFGTDREDPNYPVRLFGIDGAASSTSMVELEPAILQYDDLNPTKSTAMAATSRAKIRVPKITIFPGSLYKLEIRVLAPLELMATAGGVPGSARAHLYGALLDADRPVVAFTGVFGTQYLTGRYFSTEDGIHIHLGNGGELHLGGVSALAAAGGKSAQAVSDFVHLKLPDRIGPLHMSVDPDLGELIIETGPTISNVIKTMNKVFDKLPLPSTKIPTGSAREVRVGHMEVDVRVPTGGVHCKVEPPFVFGITDKDTGDRLSR